jgi:hypothetical protein
MFMKPRNQFQGMNSASLCSLAGRNDNTIPTLFIAPIKLFKNSSSWKRFLGIDPWTILGSEPVFVDPEIDSQPGGPVRQPYMLYRPARQHRVAASIPRNRFLGSINVYKYGLYFLLVPLVEEMAVGKGGIKIWLNGYSLRFLWEFTLKIFHTHVLFFCSDMCTRTTLLIDWQTYQFFIYSAIFCNLCLLIPFFLDFFLQTWRSPSWRPRPGPTTTDRINVCEAVNCRLRRRQPAFQYSEVAHAFTCHRSGGRKRKRLLTLVDWGPCDWASRPPPT